MKRMVLIAFLLSFFILVAFSQEIDYLKRVEHNKYEGQFYNLKSKGDKEKLLLGDFNAPVEFFYSPAFKGASAFRIMRDSLNTYHNLEVKYISNYEWVKSFNRSEQLKQCKVETLSLPISDHFAEQLYEKMVSFIVNYKGKRFNAIAFDGYSVTFRTVIGDEVWSLWISNPPDENERKMVDLCKQIISDALENQFAESEYITVLNTFEK